MDPPEAERERVADGARQVGLRDAPIVVGDTGFDVAVPLEIGLARDDADDAGRRVLAEQGGLRAAQHLYALEARQISNLRSRAGAVDAVDEYADRRLDAGIVRAVAETADDEVDLRRALELRNTQRRNDGLKVENVEDLGTLDRFSVGHGDCDRHFLQRLLTLGGRDDDLLDHRGRLRKSDRGRARSSEYCSDHRPLERGECTHLALLGKFARTPVRDTRRRTGRTLLRGARLDTDRHRRRATERRMGSRPEGLRMTTAVGAGLIRYPREKAAAHTAGGQVRTSRPLTRARGYVG